MELQELPLSTFDRGLSTHSLASFWRDWRSGRNAGYRLADISPYFRQRISLSLGSADDGLSPPLISVGPRSFVADCYGAEWARNAALLATTPDLSLERLAAPGYHAAIDGTANLALMWVRTCDAEDRPIRILYERLIVPVWTRQGRLLTCCITAPLKPIERIGSPTMPAC